MYLYQCPIDWALWALVENSAVRVNSFFVCLQAYWLTQLQKCCANSFFFLCGHSGPPIGENAVGIVQKQNTGVRVNAKATAVEKNYFLLLVAAFLSFQNWIPDIFSEGGILTVEICNQNFRI